MFTWTRLVKSGAKMTKEALETKILGYPVNVIDLDNAFSIASEALSSSKPMHIVTLNPEMIIQAQKMPDLSKSLLESNLRIPDGSGILLALLLKGIFLKNTVPGIELSEKCIEYCSINDIPIALLGAKQEVMDLAIIKLKEKYPKLKVSFSQNGYYSPENEEKIAQEIANSSPGMVLIALGVPKQETWINKYKPLFPNSTLIGVGGSFDVWSGTVKRAPKAFRMLKLEWLYRLLSDPKRAKRIFTTLPYFVIQIIFFNKKHCL